MQVQQSKQPKVYVISDEIVSNLKKSQFGIQSKYPTAAKTFTKPSTPVETDKIDTLTESQHANKLEKFTFLDGVSQDAVAKLKDEYEIDSPLVIMFANGFTSGGGGEESKKAQEENILFLSNAVYFMPKNYRRGLSIDLGGIYGIWDTKITSTADKKDHKQYTANLAFVTMPNLNNPLQGLNTPQDGEFIGPENRVAYLRHITSLIILQFHFAKKSGNVMITGRHGCGVFGNKDEDISAIIYAVTQLDQFKNIKVVYAVGSYRPTYQNPLKDKITEVNECISVLKKDLGESLSLVAVSKDVTQRYVESKLYYPETKNKIENKFGQVLEEPVIAVKDGQFFRFLHFKKESKINDIIDRLFDLGLCDLNNPDKKLSPQKQEDGSWTIKLSKAQLKLLKCAPENTDLNSSSFQNAFSDDEIKEINENLENITGLFPKISCGEDKDEAKNALKIILRLNKLRYSRESILNYINSRYIAFFTNTKAKELFKHFFRENTTSLSSSVGNTTIAPINSTTTTITSTENKTTADSYTLSQPDKNNSPIVEEKLPKAEKTELEKSFDKFKKSNFDENLRNEFILLFVKEHKALFDNINSTAANFLKNPNLDTEALFIESIKKINILSWTESFGLDDLNNLLIAILKSAAEDKLITPQITSIQARIKFLLEVYDQLSQAYFKLDSPEEKINEHEKKNIHFILTVLGLLTTLSTTFEQTNTINQILKKHPFYRPDLQIYFIASINNPANNNELLYFIHIKDESNANTMCKLLFDLGIVSRSKPNAKKTVQRNNDTDSYFISLTSAQLNLLKNSTLISKKKAFSKNESYHLKLRILNLKILYKKNPLTGIQEKINAFSLLLKFNKIGYPRQVILDYIKLDYAAAICDGDEKKLFELLESTMTTMTDTYPPGIDNAVLTEDNLPAKNDEDSEDKKKSEPILLKIKKAFNQCRKRPDSEENKKKFLELLNKNYPFLFSNVKKAIDDFSTNPHKVKNQEVFVDAFYEVHKTILQEIETIGVPTHDELLKLSQEEKNELEARDVLTGMGADDFGLFYKIILEKFTEKQLKIKHFKIVNNLMEKAATEQGKIFSIDDASAEKMARYGLQSVIFRVLSSQLAEKILNFSLTTTKYNIFFVFDDLASARKFSAYYHIPAVQDTNVSGGELPIVDARRIPGSFIVRMSRKKYEDFKKNNPELNLKNIDEIPFETRQFKSEEPAIISDNNDPLSCSNTSSNSIYSQNSKVTFFNSSNFNDSDLEKISFKNKKTLAEAQILYDLKDKISDSLKSKALFDKTQLTLSGIQKYNLPKEIITRINNCTTIDEAMNLIKNNVSVCDKNLIDGKSFDNDTLSLIKSAVVESFGFMPRDIEVMTKIYNLITKESCIDIIFNKSLSENGRENLYVLKKELKYSSQSLSM